LCISKKRNLWLWTAVSRQSSQFLAVEIGDRSQATLERLWEQIPASYRRRPVYTDEYSVYFAFFAPWQHRPSPKGSGGTSVVEGTNTSLRHRSGVLVRRTCSRSRDETMLDVRITPVLHAHNRAARKRWSKRYPATQSNG
jgi:IS1 family transposase